MSRDSAVGIATGYGLDGLRVRVRILVKVRFFFLSTSLRRVLGPTHPPGALFPNVRRPGSEADHSPTNNAEVKNTSTPLYVFTAQHLIS
jgi:hypothetical protein